jgi:protein-tyrosine phosphatase
MVSVLFVCMGNICRSPTAHGVFVKMLEDKGLLDKVRVDSAGTHAYHVGEKPDQRATEAAQKRGVDLTPLRARKALESDFEEFDYVLAMDHDNYAILASMCPAGKQDKLKMFLDFAPDDLRTREVPDPYYGGARGFEYVLDLVEDASRGLIRHLQQAHGISK